MLQDSFAKVYNKFKLQFYTKFFERAQEREASLTTVETFCMEIIHSVERPTVQEFAKIAHISGPNAAYKIGCLIKKGYLKKTRSEIDRRAYYLEVTDKYMRYYNIGYDYIGVVMDRIKEKFTPEEVETLERILIAMNEELMPELEF